MKLQMRRKKRRKMMRVPLQMKVFLLMKTGYLQTILERIVTYKPSFQFQEDRQFNKLFKCLAEDEETVVVPTDKTNSYK
eukprot:5140618-Ditylum_brightwellii.AAC.1